MARFIRRPIRPGDDEGAATAVGGAVPVVTGETAVLPHGAQIGGYRVGPQLGRGGMGVVYQAHHVRLDRPAALKVLAPALAQDDGFRGRFMRESQMAAALQHPNVVTVYDAGEENGLLYLAMQYVAGTDLRRMLDLEGPLDANRLVGVLAQVASALDAAHARDVVHRDVKPANILLDVDRAFLGDFGLAKRFDASGGLTGVNQLVGTVDYLAPEQIEGKKVDGRADMYALGCVAYQCLAGRPPHAKDSDIAVLFAHVKEDPEPISRLRDDLAPGVDNAIARVLHKEPGRRYGSCREFAIELAAELGVEMPAAIGQEASAHVLVASQDASTRAIVRGSLANMGVAVGEALPGAAPAHASERRVDAVVADVEFPADELVQLRELLRRGTDGEVPKLLLLVPRGNVPDSDARPADVDDELAKPFSGMQLALKLRKLLGPQAVRA